MQPTRNATSQIQSGMFPLPLLSAHPMMTRTTGSSGQANMAPFFRGRLQTPVWGRHKALPTGVTHGIRMIEALPIRMAISRGDSRVAAVGSLGMTSARRVPANCSRFFFKGIFAVRSCCRSFPMCSTNDAHSGPNCRSNSWRSRAARAGLFPPVEIAICSGPRRTTAG